MSTKKVATKVKDFYAQFPKRQWPSKQILVHALDDPPGIYYIEKGEIRQYTIDYRGNEVVVNTFRPGSFMPLSLVYTDIKNKYYFETTKPSTLRLAPKQDVERFIKANSDVSQDLLERLYSGIDGMLTKIVYLMSNSAYVRVINELIIQVARQKLKTDSVLLPLKEYELGAYCGLSRETISREFKKLKTKKLVSINASGITIKSLKRLEKELEKSA